VSTYRTLAEDLADLERTDPAVRAAARSYGRMVERITGRETPCTSSGSSGSAETGPSVFRRCPHEDCGRTVGPYHDPRIADASIRLHVNWRHVAVRMAHPAQ
jgi:hypothetical protein